MVFLMAQEHMQLIPIGIVHSELTNPSDAPRQGSEGGPSAWLEIDPAYQEGLLGIRPGSELILLTWLHLAERDHLQTHPRGDRSKPLTGVFSSRSPHRPNPIGLHRVTVLAVERNWIQVHPLEAVDGTPIIDIKSVITDVEDW